MTVDRSHAHNGLTARELAILRSAVTHASYADVADDLCVSRNTVKTHVAHIYAKLGVHTREEAIAKARSLGVLDGQDLPGHTRPDEDDDEVGSRVAEGAQRAHQRALMRLCTAIANTPTTDAIAELVALDLAALVGADYSTVALIDGAVLRVSHHQFLDEAIAIRYTTLPFDDSTPLGTASRTARPVIMTSLASYTQQYSHMLPDVIASGLDAAVAYPITGQGAIGIAWAHGHAPTIDDTITTLALVSDACITALRSARR
jgi:LuxR family maltose regulon positive regulatory protein